MKRLLPALLLTSAMLHAQDWNKLVDRYFDEAVFPFSPSNATTTGFHQWDSRLEDFSDSAIKRHADLLRQFEREVSAFPPAQMDRDLVLANIHSALLDFESVRGWEKNPDLYSSTASNAVFVIMSRKFAPVESRLESAIARETAIPKLLGAARANLKNPPKIYTEVAIEQLPGIISFFEKDVPAAFTEVKSPALLARFRKANADVIAQLKSYQVWLRTDLLPRSHGDFRIGADNYRKKLLYDDMVDIPLDRLLRIGYDDLHRNQQWFRDTAKKIDPNKTP
jgi:hypothetical protein